MPIDYRIPAEIGAIRSRMIDPMTLANLREQVTLRREKQAQEQAQMEQQNTLRNLLSQTVTPEGQINQNAFAAYMQSGGDPRDVAAVRQSIMGPQETAKFTAPRTVRDVVREGKSGQLVITPEGERFEPYPEEKPAAPKSPQRAPLGYRYKDDGSLEPIPGGPAAGGGIGGKPPTESQQKFSLYAQSLGDALPSLNQLYATGYQPSPAALKLIALDPTAWSTSGLMGGMSQPDLEWASLVQGISDAIVRPRSGAAITAGDVANTLSAYIPLPSEGPETRRRKMANLEKQRTYLMNISEGRGAGISKPTAPAVPSGRPATSGGKQPARPPLSAFGGK
jgi:hypothetical protein